MQISLFVASFAVLFSAAQAAPWVSCGPARITGITATGCSSSQSSCSVRRGQMASVTVKFVPPAAYPAATRFNALVTAAVSYYGIPAGTYTLFNQDDTCNAYFSSGCPLDPSREVAITRSFLIPTQSPSGAQGTLRVALSSGSRTVACITIRANLID